MIRYEMAEQSRHIWCTALKSAVGLTDTVTPW